MKAILNNNNISAKFIENDRKYFKYGNTINANIIGNPTIENGIVSNFSQNNYLTLPFPFSCSYEDDWEIVFKAVDINYNLSGRSAFIGTGLVGTNEASNSYCELSVSGNAQHGKYVYPRFISEVFIGSANNKYIQNTDCYFKYKYKYVQSDTYPFKYSTYYSLDGVTWISYNSSASYSQYHDFKTTPFKQIGLQYSYNNYSQSGEYLIYPHKIDMKKSYIKINDELWWTGTLLEECGADDDYDFYINTKKIKLPKF